MPNSLILKGELSILKLKKAYEIIIKRHEILRTAVFINSKNQIRQKPLSLAAVNFDIEFIDLKNQMLDEESIEVKSLINSLSDVFLNISEGKVIKITVIQLSNTKSILHQVLHHIAGDEWSMNVLINELLIVYNNLHFEKLKLKKILKPLEIQYKEFAQWEHQFLTQNTELKDFWLNQFKQPLPILNLPVDFRQDNYQNMGNEYRLSFNKTETEKARKFILDYQISKTIFFTNLIHLLFCKYTGCEDFIINLISAQREKQNLDNQMGPYLNTIPIRLKSDLESNFFDSINQSKDVILNSISHGKYPYDYIKENIYPSQSREIKLVLNVMNNMEIPKSKLDFANNLKILPYMSGYKRSKFPLTFYIFESNDQFEITIEYKTEMFTYERIQKIADLFTKLFVHVLENPSKKLQSIVFQNQLELPKITKLKR